MSAAGYIWRVTGTWPPPEEIEEGYAPSSPVRHYMTEGAAKRRAKVWLEGVHEPGGYDHMNGFADDYVVPAALSVTVERSNPVTWPAA